eukprot:10765-Eustigmatos_ZCMA.PRE.1
MCTTAPTVLLSTIIPRPQAPSQRSNELMFRACVQLYDCSAQSWDSKGLLCPQKYIDVQWQLTVAAA